MVEIMIYGLLNVNYDWNLPDSVIQIIASIIGAFLGFLFAIKVSKIDSLKQCKEHIKNLHRELVDFCSSESLLKQKVTEVEDLKIIELPFLERTINYNFGANILDVEIMHNFKIIYLYIEQINFIFAKKNDFYYENALELAIIAQKNVDFGTDISQIMTKNSLENKYIAYNKTVYDKIVTLFSYIQNNDILNKFCEIKKVKNIIK